MSIAENDKIDVNISDNSISIILEDESFFNDVAFKVLQNQEKYGLLKCGKLSQNGKIKLVYDCSKYKPLNTIVHQIKPKEFLTIVSNIHDVLNRITENGFIKIENLLVTDTTIFVDITDFRIYLVCLPLTTLIFENKEVVKQELESVVCNIARKIEDLSATEVKKILNEGNFVITNKPKTEIKENKPQIKNFNSEEKINKQEKKYTKTAFTVLIVIELISILIGITVITIKQVLGFIILVVGCFLGIIIFLVFQNRSQNLNKKTMKKITLLSTNIEPRIRFDITKFPYTIGRQYGSVDGLIDNQKTVGRIHCMITEKGGQYYIEDLNSMNGTYVNNRRLVNGQKEVVNKGDIVRISKIEFIVK